MHFDTECDMYAEVLLSSYLSRLHYVRFLWQVCERRTGVCTKPLILLFLTFFIISLLGLLGCYSVADFITDAI